MLVQFQSSETAEILMYAEVAGGLLRALGKETTARGVFTPAEMLPAVARLREAVANAEAASEAPPADEDLTWEEQTRREKEKPVALRRRAWPLIDMLERTAKSGPEAWVTWEASGPF